MIWDSSASSEEVPVEKDGIKKIQIRIEKIINLKIDLFIKSPPWLKIKKKFSITKLLFMAGVLGFEPRQAVLETDVLPLTLCPYVILLYSNTFFYFWQYFLKIF